MLGILEKISPSELVSNGYISNHNKVRRPRPKFKVSFYASAPKVPEALHVCFRVVRPSGSPSGFCRLRDNKYYLMEFHQTWYRGPPPGVDELIRFWARSAQHQGSKVNELGLNMLFYPVYAITQVLLDGISSNLVQGCTTRSR